MLYLSLIFLGALLVISIGAGLLVKALLDERARAEVAWARERQVLLQRIQAPESAILEHQQAAEVVSATAPHVPFDNDDEFWETKEQLADRVAGVNGGGDG